MEAVDFGRNVNGGESIFPLNVRVMAMMLLSMIESCVNGSKREVEVNVDDEIDGYPNLMEGLFKKKKSGGKKVKNDEVDGDTDLMRRLFNKKQKNRADKENHDGSAV